VSSSLDRQVVAEAVGTTMRLAAVVGSGIMGERLAGGNVAVALLANTLATGAAQRAGAGVATSLFRWLAPTAGAETQPTTVVHTEGIAAERFAIQRGGHP